jgi:outer membrane immunogenic protein
MLVSSMEGMMGRSVANADQALHVRIVAVALAGSSALIAAALLASSAKAADVANFPLPYHASGPIVGSPHDWTGVYLGAQVGYGWGQSSGTQNAGGTFFPVVPYAIDPAGAFVGGHLGFNYQTGAIVLGVEADLEASNLEGNTAFSAFNQTYFFNVKADTLASLRGRAGWADDQLMLYGTAGMAWSHVTSPPLANLDGWRTGWTVGAGIERALPRNWSAKLEYRYTDLGRASSFDPILNSTDDTTLAFHAIRFAVSRKFGRAP